LFAYIDTRDYGEYLEIAEDLNLRIMDVIKAAGTEDRQAARIARLPAGRIARD
jgi:hypothetical protein